MASAEMIVHKGKSIVVIDVRGERDVTASLEAFARAEELIRKFPPKTARLLTNVTKAHYSRDATQRLKAFSKAITPFMLASAAVGIDGMMEVLVRSLIALTGRNIKLFDDVAEAKDWLASQ